MCVYVYVCVHVRRTLRVWVGCLCECVYECTCVSVCANVCMYVCLWVRVLFPYMDMGIYIYIYKLAYYIISVIGQLRNH